MKRITTFLAALAFAATAAMTQNLIVNCGPVKYIFSSEQTGIMPYTNLGRTVEIMGKAFEVSEVTAMSITIDNNFSNNLISIDYTNDGASVTIAGNVARYVDVSVDGAHVSITQSSEVGDATCGEITYRLSGTSTAGSFAMTGSYKASIELNGLSLISDRGAALDIQNGKRIAIRVTEGTTNSLTDAAAGSQKGCIVCKGHLEFKQKGELTVTGLASHGIYCKEYIQIKNSKITVNGAAKDGLNCAQYFLMESGSLTIANTADDGIQTSFKDDVDRETEDTGTITIAGGTLNIDVSATACKALKADGDFIMTAGTITASTSGHGKWDDKALKTKAASCISTDGNITISGGTLNLTSTGSGGKGLNCDGEINIVGGNLNISTSGGIYAYVNGTEYTNYTGNTDYLASDSKSSPKGIKCDGNITINGGEFNINCTGTGAEGIESKSTMTINNGNIKVRTKDDCLNSSNDMIINGGTVEVISSSNDGLDANGNMYINGGLVKAFGASAPECGIDVNDEEGYKLYITGGYVLGVGGNNSTPSTTTNSQAYLLPSISVSGGTTLSVSTPTDELFTFEIPADYAGSSSTTGPGGRPGGSFGPGGFGSSSGILLSIPGLTSGSSYTVATPSSTASATAK